MKLLSTRLSTQLILVFPESVFVRASLSVRKKLGKPTEHTGALAQIISDLAEKKASVLAYGLNESTLLTDKLISTIEASISNLRSESWALIGTSTVNTDGERKSCVYSQTAPSLPDIGIDRDIANAGYDVCLLNLRTARKYIRSVPPWITESFNASIIHLARTGGIPSLYVGSLIHGCREERTPNDAIAISELKRVRGILPVNEYYTLQGIRKEIRKRESSPEKRPYNLPADQPFLSIVIRTNFKRVELLKRALASIYFASLKRQVVYQTILVSSQFENYPPELSKVEHLVKIKKVRVEKSASIPSRTINLIRGVEASDCEYVYFLDDDDYVCENFFDKLMDKVASKPADIIFFDTEVVQEELDESTGRLTVKNKVVIKRYLASDSISFWNGVNQSPICGFISRAEKVKQFIKKGLLRHDLSEDYALLLGLVTSDVTVSSLQQVLATISVRKSGDNTVTAEDRTEWLRNIADHLSELYSDNDVATRLQLLKNVGGASRGTPSQYEVAYKKLVEAL